MIKNLIYVLIVLRTFLIPCLGSFHILSLNSVVNWSIFLQLFAVESCKTVFLKLYNVSRELP